MAENKTDTDTVVAEIRKILSEAGLHQHREAARLQMLDQRNTSKFRWCVRVCVVGAVFLWLNVFPHPLAYLLERLFWLAVFLWGFVMAGKHLHCTGRRSQGPSIEFPLDVTSGPQGLKVAEKPSLKQVI